MSAAKRRAHVLAHRDALQREQPLERGLPREALDERAELAEARGAFGRRVAHDGDDLARERRRERRHGAAAHRAPSRRR